MSSAIRFNLDQSIILSSVNGLTLYPTVKWQTGSDSRHYADIEQIEK